MSWPGSRRVPAGCSCSAAPAPASPRGGGGRGLRRAVLGPLANARTRSQLSTQCRVSRALERAKHCCAGMNARAARRRSGTGQPTRLGRGWAGRRIPRSFPQRRSSPQWRGVFSVEVEGRCFSLRARGRVRVLQATRLRVSDGDRARIVAIWNSLAERTVRGGACRGSDRGVLAVAYPGLALRGSGQALEDSESPRSAAWVQSVDSHGRY